MKEGEKVGEKMIGRETIVEEGRVVKIKILKGSKRKQTFMEEQELVQMMRGGQQDVKTGYKAQKIYVCSN